MKLTRQDSELPITLREVVKSKFLREAFDEALTAANEKLVFVDLNGELIFNYDDGSENYTDSKHLTTARAAAQTTCSKDHVVIYSEEIGAETTEFKECVGQARLVLDPEGKIYSAILLNDEEGNAVGAVKLSNVSSLDLAGEIYKNAFNFNGDSYFKEAAGHYIITLAEQVTKWRSTEELKAHQAKVELRLEFENKTVSEAAREQGFEQGRRECALVIAELARAVKSGDVDLQEGVLARHADAIVKSIRETDKPAG